MLQATFVHGFKERTLAMPFLGAICSRAKAASSSRDWKDACRRDVLAGEKRCGQGTDL